MQSPKLERLTNQTKRRHIAVFDIETYTDSFKDDTAEVHPFALGFDDGRKYMVFEGKDCAKDFLNYVLCKRYRNYWIYAHYGGGFDFRFLLHALTSGAFFQNYRIELIPIGSAIVRIDIQDKESKWKWTFLDSYRLAPLALGSRFASDGTCLSSGFARTFGVGEKTEIDYVDMRKDRRWRDYLRNDCRITRLAIEKMQDMLLDLGGQVCMTLASCAMDIYRRKFLSSDVWRNTEHVDFVKAAYFGGRTEIYRTSGKNLDYFDFNSMYAACMRNAMPTGKAEEGDERTENEVYKRSQREIGYVACTVQIPSDCYLPPLPTREKDKVLFKTGRLTGVWDTSELKLLKECGGRIVEVTRCLWFSTSTIFADYVDACYKLRDTDNDGMRFVGKSLLTNLYGKFGINTERQMIVVNPDEEDWTGPCCDRIDCPRCNGTNSRGILSPLYPQDDSVLRGEVYLKEVTIEPAYLCMQLAAHVTALARCLYWRTAMRILKEGGKLYYGDTDSLIIDRRKDGSSRIQSSKKLGEMKLEYRVKEASFSRPKMYRMIVEGKDEPIIRMKGFGKGFGKSIGEQDWEQVVNMGLKITRERFLKIRESLRRKIDTPSVVRSPKGIKSQYDKRQVLEDGNTLPLGATIVATDELPF
jgi:hypothetical protein